MGNPLFRKQFRMVLFNGLGVLSSLFVLGSLSLGDGGGFVGFLFALGFFYLGFGIDIQRKRKAINIINSYISKHTLGDSIVLIEDTFLKDYERGHLALTQHYLFFVNRKGKVFEFNLHNLTNYGYKYVGTGQYATTFHNVGHLKVGSTTEGKVPIFYIEMMNNNNEQLLAFYCMRHKKFYKHLDKNWNSGTLAKERNEFNETRKQKQAADEEENAAMLNRFGQIMDPELTELNRGVKVLLQNGKTFEEALYSLYKKQMPKLFSLTPAEETILLNYLNVCTIRGHRTAIALLFSKGCRPTTDEENIIFTDDQLAGKYESLGRFNYPIFEQVMYAQYKFFRSVNHKFLSEQEVLDMTKEFIHMGFKNTLSNYLTLEEYRKRKPANVY